MNKITVGLAMLALAAASAIASAEETPPPPSPPDQTTQPAPPAQPAPAMTPAAAKDPMDEMVCRKETLTGSRLGGKRVCLTRREWDQITRDSQDALRKTQDKSGAKNPSSGGGG